MSRLKSLVHNYSQIEKNYRPSEVVMTSIGWRYTKTSDMSPFRQWGRHRKDAGLHKFPLNKAYGAIKLRTWEVLDV